MCKCRNVNVKSLRVGFKMRRRLATVKEETVRKSLCSSDTAIYGAVTVTAVLSYVNSLGGEFVHDDIPAIVDNADVTGASSLRNLLLNDFWGMPMADVNSHKSYRPLTTLSFRLNYALCGLRPAWWHVCNIVLHAACCVLVARACVQVARLQRPFAGLAALLFAVHPIHTEAVAGVVGRADVLACIFFLSSLLVYHRPKSKKKCVWLSIVLGALSMLAKETGVTILMLNLAFDFYRCWPLVKRSLSSLRVEKKNTGLSVRTFKVLVSLALLVCLRLALLQGSLPTFSPQDNPAAFHPSFVVRFMTFCYLAAFNWWLLLCPWSLSHDWQMGSVPLVTSGWDPRNMVTCAALGALLLLCYRCICDLEAQKHTPIVVGVLVLVIPFVPASNLFVTVGFVIAERVLYIPSVGSVIITAYGVQLMWYSRPGAKVFLAIGLVILAISGVVRTHRRNTDWKDRATLLRADLLTLPHNAKLQYNFGNFLRETDHQDQAIRHYKEALRLWPTYASAHNNLGTMVTRVDNAEYHFLQAIKYNRHHVNAHYNLGKLYKKSGKTYQAIELFERCLSLQPHFIQAYIELLSLKSDEAKKKILEKILKLETNNWAHYVLYGNWLKSKGLIQAASLKYVEATRLSFEHQEAKHLRGDIVSMRLVALCYRSLGYKSRILQLLSRWHTWRRGRLSPAPNIYLQEWHLKLEMKKKAQIYTKATTLPVKSTRCFDYSQLSVKTDEALVTPKTTKSQNNSALKKHKIINNNNDCSKCNKKCRNNAKETNKNSVVKVNNKDCEIVKINREMLNAKNKHLCNHKNGTKKRTVSLTSNIKTIHNKSETGQEKDKQCSLDKKKKDGAVVNPNSNMPRISAPLTGDIIFNTF